MRTGKGIAARSIAGEARRSTLVLTFVLMLPALISLALMLVAVGLFSSTTRHMEQVAALRPMVAADIPEYIWDAVSGRVSYDACGAEETLRQVNSRLDALISETGGRLELVVARRTMDTLSGYAEEIRRGLLDGTPIVEIEALLDEIRSVAALAENMLSDCIAMVGIVLLRLHALVELRQELFRDPRLPGCPEEFRPVRHQRLLKLIPYSLGTDPPQIRRKLRSRFESGAVDLIAQLRAETDGSHDPQRVFRKALPRISDRADDSLLQVLLSAEQIDQAAFPVIRHRVDRKIPSLKVFLQARSKSHFPGVASVLIDAVHPEGGNLITRPAAHDSHRSVLQACVDRSGKQCFDLQWQRGSGDVPVVGFAPQKCVAHAAADHVSLVAGALKRIENSIYLFRYLNLNLHAITSSPRTNRQ